VHPLWNELRRAIPLIVHQNQYVMNVTWTTIRVALVSTGCALALGMPIALTIGLGRFRGRRVLHILANASLALPPVLVGVWVLVFLVPHAPFGSLRYANTLTAVYIAQTVLALPFMVALVPAAIQALPPGLLDQARAFGASRRQLSMLALREARIGVLVAVIAALASTLTEVAAVIIVGGNQVDIDQTLASAIVEQIGNGTTTYALALGIVLLALVLVLMAVLTALQQFSGGIHLRFRTTS
jgi:tungstate transport system permease protein